MNLSQSDIARSLNRDQSTISKYLQNKDNIDGKKNSDRKKILTQRDKRRILNVAVNENLSSRKIITQLNLDVSKNTVLRVINSDNNIKYSKHKSKPNLKKQQIETRRTWAQDYLTWDEKYCIFIQK